MVSSKCILPNSLEIKRKWESYEDSPEKSRSNQKEIPVDEFLNQDDFESLRERVIFTLNNF